MNRLRVVVAVLVALSVCGCPYGKRKRMYILRESEQFYLIPAGTPFTAIVTKGEPPVQVTRNADSWAVDAGYLLKLQKEANARILEPPD